MDALDAMKAAAHIAAEAADTEGEETEAAVQPESVEATEVTAAAEPDGETPQPDVPEQSVPAKLTAEERFRRMAKEDRPAFAEEMIRLCAEASGDKIAAVRHGKLGHQPEHLLPDDDPEPEIWSADSRNGRTYTFRSGMVHRTGALPVGLTMERFREGVWEVSDGASWYRPTGAEVNLREWVRALGKGLVRVGSV